MRPPFNKDFNILHETVGGVYVLDSISKHVYAGTAGPASHNANLPFRLNINGHHRSIGFNFSDLSTLMRWYCMYIIVRLFYS